LIPIDSLPARLLRSLGTPLSGRSGRVPVSGSALGLAPLSSRRRGSEASRSCLPLASGGETGLDGDNTLLLNAGELLLLNLLLGLSLGVAV